MKLVEITYTLTTTIRVEVPSCLSDPEIGQLAQRHLDANDELFITGAQTSVSVAKADGPYLREQGLLGVATVDGVWLMLSDEDDAAETDEQFEEMTGRAPPPDPQQEGFKFDKEKP